MIKLTVLLVSVLVSLLVGCSTTPQRSQGVKAKFDAIVKFESLNEAAQKEAVRLGYGPGDTVKIEMDERGNAKIVPRK